MTTLIHSTIDIQADNPNVGLVKPIFYMCLDVVGVLLIFLGLGQQFGSIDVFPTVLNVNHIGLILISIGLGLTLPFLAWTVKTCSKLINNISI